jgi:flagellar hook assembly protein FlgD
MIATLGQNVPNPFNPTTSIPYTLERGANVVIGIYDASGTRVAQLSEGLRSPGAHSAMWSGRDASGGAVASGVYFYRLEGAGDISARKMILLK